MDNACLSPSPSELSQPGGRTPSFAEAAGPAFWLCVGWVILVAVCAFSADAWPLAAYDRMDFEHLSAPPGTGARIDMDSSDGFHPEKPYTYLLGTDTMGRDMAARLVFGARVSLTVGLSAPLIGLVLGAVFGMIAGYLRGWTDALLSFIMDTILAFPGLVFLLAVTFYWGLGLKTIIIGLAVLTIPSFFRVARANTRKYADRDFVLASRMAGRSIPGIIVFDLAPNVIVSLLVYALIVVSYMIVAEGVLSYLGLSVPSPMPSWGGMIAEGREVLGTAAHVSLIPAAVMFMTIFSFNLIGDTFRSMLDT